MKRREALRYVMMATATAVVLPSCVFNKKKEASVSLKNLPITGDQEETLAQITETLIPETDIVGAKSLGAHLFVLKMVNDCYDPKTQESFMKGLGQVDDITDKKFGKSFGECTVPEREEILKSFDAKEASIPAEALEFYQLTRRHTIQAFMSCEYVMTKIEGYEYLPGRFNGCVDVKTKKAA